MATMITDTACVDPRAELGDEVEIGPFCIVGPDVRIGRGTRLIGHVCVLGRTTIGQHNTIHPFAVLGGDPQATGELDSTGRVEIGDGNILREGVTINRGSAPEGGTTRIGSRTILMATVHVGHDCRLGDSVTVANGVTLGGHVHVESHATLSGGVVVHPYVTVGDGSFVGGQTRLFHDVPRYVLVDGSPPKARCINAVGLKRRGFDKATIDAIHEAHRLIFRAKMDPAEAERILESHGHRTPEVRALLDSVRAQQQGRHGRARDRSWRPVVLPAAEDESD